MTSSVGSSLPGGAALSEERWARLAWSRIIEPQTVWARNSIRAHGASEALDRLLAGGGVGEGQFAERIDTLARHRPCPPGARPPWRPGRHPR